MTGDLNVDMNKPSNSKNIMQMILEKNGLQLRIDFNTRIDSCAESLIDIVATNQGEMVDCNAILNNRVSDHESFMMKLY